MLSWEDALQAEGAGQMRHLKSLVLSRPYFGRVPDQSVIEANAWWYDPRTGSATRVPGDFPTTGSRILTPPTAGEDWVLVLDGAAERFAAPGTRPS